MPDTGNALPHQLLMKLMQLPSTNTNLHASYEEEEADEPPDEPNLHFTNFPYHSDGEFQKHTVVKPTPHASLLTQALTSPPLLPVDHSHFSRGLLSQFSGTSTWSLSGASTAELTSDGGLTSRSHSPSPSPPAMIGHLGRLFHDRKAYNANPQASAHASDHCENEEQGKKKAIRFACNNNPSSPQAAQTSDDAMLQKRPCTLKFACTQQDAKQSLKEPRKPPTIRFSSPNFNEKMHRDSETTLSASTKCLQLTSPKTFVEPTISSSNTATRFYEFASSVEETESWMQHPPNGSRLLRVDGVLDKEKKIRKLTEEAEAEELQEGEDDEDENDELEDDVDFDGVDEYDLEEDEEDDNLSGNESDNEEGFASDDDDEDDTFFHCNYRSQPTPTLFRRPLCCRNTSTRSIENKKHRELYPTKMDLPDSTDFVCGTFDEDKALEDAYVSALEEKKRARHRITPQDIDPSFPVSDPEDDDEDSTHTRNEEYLLVRGRLSSSDDECGMTNRGILNYSPRLGTAKIRFRSPALPRRTQSPAPKRRILSPPPPPSRRGSKHTTPPVSRRNSNDQSSHPTMLRRGSRALSPPPPRNIRIAFSSRPKLERTKSLPKNIRRPLSRGRSTGVSAGHSPKGALPIGAGGTKKPRRKDGFGRVRQDSWTRRGEGVEKMRELGLMLGKGKPAPWLSSV